MSDWISLGLIVLLSGFFGFMLGVKIAARRERERQPSAYDLVLLDSPLENPSGVRGVPLYFWRTDDRSVSFFPIPEPPIRLCIRLKGDS